MSVTYSSDLSSYERGDSQSTSTRDARQIADVLRAVGQKGWEFYKRWRVDQCSGESITREEILQLPALEVDLQVLNLKGHHEYKCLFCGNPSHSNSREDGSSFAVWLRMRDSGNWKRPLRPTGQDQGRISGIQPVRRSQKVLRTGETRHQRQRD